MIQCNLRRHSKHDVHSNIPNLQNHLKSAVLNKNIANTAFTLSGMVNSSFVTSMNRCPKLRKSVGILYATRLEKMQHAKVFMTTMSQSLLHLVSNSHNHHIQLETISRQSHALSFYRNRRGHKSHQIILIFQLCLMCRIHLQALHVTR
jgi:hypothetical protein